MKNRVLMMIAFLNAGSCLAQGGMQKIFTILWKNYRSYNKEVLFGQSFAERERILFKRINYGVGGLVIFGIGGYSWHSYKTRKYWDKIFFDSIENDNQQLLRIAMDQGAPKKDSIGVRFVSENGTGDLVSREDIMMSGLHLASITGKKDCVAHLIESQGEINRLDSAGNTPLHLAAMYKQVDVVRMLLACGANPNATDHAGRTVVHIVARNRDLEVLRVLLSEKIINIRTRDKRGCTPLHEAVRGVMDADKNEISECKEVIRLLLEHGANRYDIDFNDNTPLDYARGNNRSELVPLLLGDIGDCCQ